jgi:hypothetical protein
MYDSTDYGTLLLVWIVGSVIVYVVAKNRGLAPAGYILLSILLSPIIGLVAVLLSKPKTERRAPCWQCREMVVEGAAQCRFCGAKLVWPGTPQPPAINP